MDYLKETKYKTKKRRVRNPTENFRSKGKGKEERVLHLGENEQTGTEETE